MSKILAAAGAAMLATLGGQSLAANSCTVSATSMAFGVYIPAGGPAYSTSTIKVACTSGAFFAVGLSSGSSGSQAQRLLMDGSYTVQYNLYTSSAYSAIWGDGTGSSQVLSGTGAGPNTPLSFTAYGLLPDNAFNQDAVPGPYTDTILVVISY